MDDLLLKHASRRAWTLLAFITFLGLAIGAGLFGYLWISRSIGYSRVGCILHIAPTPDGFDQHVRSRLKTGMSRQQVHAEIGNIGNAEVGGWYDFYDRGNPTDMKCETVYFYLDGLPVGVRALKTWQAYDICYIVQDSGRSTSLATLRPHVS